jgi:Flp pilus assembly protein TadG
MSVQFPQIRAVDSRSSQTAPRHHLAGEASSRRGAVTIEFAVNASLFFMLILMSFEFARFMMVRQTMDQSTYEGARYGIIPGHTADGVRTKTSQFLTTFGIRNPTITITPATIDSNTRAVTVEVTANFSDSAWITPMFARDTIIRSRMTLDHENLAVLLYDP